MGMGMGAGMGMGMGAGPTPLPPLDPAQSLAYASQYSAHPSSASPRVPIHATAGIGLPQSASIASASGVRRTSSAAQPFAPVPLPSMDGPSRVPRSSSSSLSNSSSGSAYGTGLVHSEASTGTSLQPMTDPRSASASGIAAGADAARYARARALLDTTVQAAAAGTLGKEVVGRTLGMQAQTQAQPLASS